MECVWPVHAFNTPAWTATVDEYSQRRAIGRSAVISPGDVSACWVFNRGV